ncbi:MAG: hypothetical protein MJ092_02945 [Lachnospiraceae bacterium]|nr:hypothetical protein [Lachnospiraceae bacterium]
MKKVLLKYLLPLSLMLVVVLSLCACSCGGNSKKEEKETTKQATTTAPETTVPETTVPETSSNLPTEEEMTIIAKDLIEACNTIKQLSSCAIEKDTDTTYTSPEGYLYYYVTDSRFQNFGDINEFVDQHFTLSYASEKYPWLATPDKYDGVPPFLYLTDPSSLEGLYVIQGGKGFSIFDPESELTFSDVTPDSFTVSLEYNNFGEQARAYIHIVKDNGTWKVNGVDDNN